MALKKICAVLCLASAVTGAVIPSHNGYNSIADPTSYQSLESMPDHMATGYGYNQPMFTASGGHQMDYNYQPPGMTQLHYSNGNSHMMGEQHPYMTSFKYMPQTQHSATSYSSGIMPEGHAHDGSTGYMYSGHHHHMQPMMMMHSSPAGSANYGQGSMMNHYGGGQGHHHMYPMPAELMNPGHKSNSYSSAADVSHVSFSGMGANYQW